MDEARRFLRYITPGVVFGVEATLLALVVLPESTVSLIRSLSEKDSISVGLGGLFASGALGYLFATLHHWLNWNAPFDRQILDHEQLINSILEKQEIGDQPLGSKVKRQKAIEMSLSLWYQRVKSDGPIGEAADKKVSSLGDQAHGLGAARVASFFALIAVAVVCSWNWEVSVQGIAVLRFGLMIAFWIAVTLLFHFAYRRVGTIAQGVYGEILTDALAKERPRHDIVECGD